MASHSNEIPDYIVNIRWIVEGFALLAVGILGIIGNKGKCIDKIIIPISSDH